jgi:NAD(P)H dehydrogenase (quinone)
MQALIVLAQPEPRSFNARLAAAAAARWRQRGVAVEISDLYGQGFDPVEAPRHYAAPNDPAYFDVQGEQRHAARAGTLPAAVEAEIDKVLRADFILFQYPMWWWGPPAILKGWFDRVLVYGRMYTSRQRFEHGLLTGKRAMLSVTQGASAGAGSPSGNEGDCHLIVWPLHISLRYCGLSVLPPLFSFGVHGGLDETAAAALTAAQARAEADLIDRIDRFAEIPELPFNPMDDFGADDRLKPGAPSYTPFIRQREVLDLG